MLWEINNYLFGETDNFILKENIACFDLDNTLIKPKSNKKFPIDKNDWIFLYDNIKNKINEYIQNNYCVIIITNQAGIKKGKINIDDFKDKIFNIQANLNIPIRIYASIDNDIYRKPYPTFWKIISENININYNNSFYCGDACGRINDHNDTDYKFALNNNIKFYTPEELFLNIKDNTKKINYIDLNNIKDILINKDRKNKIIQQRKFINDFDINKKYIILMYGYPASGKSYISKYINKKYNFLIINQDILKTKSKCLNKAIECIKNNHSFIIDNTNFNKNIRKEFLNLVNNNYTKICINILCDKDISYHNSLYRAYDNYLNQKPISYIPKLVYNIQNKQREEPDLYEFDKIYNIDFIPPNDNDYFYYFY